MLYSFLAIFAALREAKWAQPHLSLYFNGTPGAWHLAL
jgi:hypothetical protein